MRVDPQYVNNLTGALDQVTANQDSLSEELSSGMRVNSLGGDPVAAGQNVLLNSQLSLDDTFSQTADSAESMLQVSDSALGDVVTQLTKAISLATEANTGTLDASQISDIGTQLSGIRDEVIALANTTYLGQSIFAGSQGSSAAYSSTGTYQGDTIVSYVETPNGQKIQLNVPGSQIFSAGGTSDVMAVLNSLVSDFSSGTVSSSAVADASALNTALNYVSGQRTIIDNSITRLQTSASYSETEATNLESSQTSLLQADVGQVSTQLSLAESQESALASTIAAIDKEGSLFSYIQ